jgi:hypothetical protein
MNNRLVLSVDYFTIGMIDLGRATAIVKPHDEYWCNRLFDDFEEILLVWQIDEQRAERTVTEFFLEETDNSIHLWLQVFRSKSEGSHFWWYSFRDLFPDVWMSHDLQYSLEKFSMWMSEGEGKHSANRHDIAVHFCEKYENLFDTVTKETIFRAFWAYRCNQTEFYVDRCFVENIG